MAKLASLFLLVSSLTLGSLSAQTDQIPESIVGDLKQANQYLKDANDRNLNLKTKYSPDSNDPSSIRVGKILSYVSTIGSVSMRAITRSDSNSEAILSYSLTNLHKLAEQIGVNGLYIAEEENRLAKVGLEKGIALPKGFPKDQPSASRWESYFKR